MRHPCSPGPFPAFDWDPSEEVGGGGRDTTHGCASSSRVTTHFGLSNSLPQRGWWRIPWRNSASTWAQKRHGSTGTNTSVLSRTLVQRLVFHSENEPRLNCETLQLSDKSLLISVYLRLPNCLPRPAYLFCSLSASIHWWMEGFSPLAERAAAIQNPNPQQKRLSWRISDRRDGSHENDPRPSDLLLDIPFLLLHYLSHSSHHSLEITLINVTDFISTDCGFRAYLTAWKPPPCVHRSPHGMP